MFPDITRVLRLGSVGCCLVTAVACSDATTPKPATRTTLSAASPTKLMGTVGKAVADPPLVTVRDSSGRPVAGVVVMFAVTDGGGTIQVRTTLSSTDGSASVERWTLGTVPGSNSVTATNASGDDIVFTAEADPGSPSKIQKVGGDGQAGLPGAVLAARPRVRISDLFDNPLAGVEVTFAVEGGGGSVSQSSSVTDRDGIAESGDWVLGTAGSQRMVARAGSLVAEPFSARVVLPPAPCANSGTLQAATATRVELSSLGCNVYTIVVPTMTAYYFTAASPDFDTNLQLRGPDLAEVAGNDDISTGSTSSGFAAMLVPGTYTLYVTSKPGGGGSFDVAYYPANPDVDGCQEAFVVRGITMQGVVGSLACAPDPFTPADRFRIYLSAGQPIDIQVEDLSYSGPNIRMVGPDGHQFDGHYSANYLTSLVAVAPVDGYYLIMVGLVNEIGTTYELRVR